MKDCSTGVDSGKCLERNVRFASVCLGRLDQTKDRHLIEVVTVKACSLRKAPGKPFGEVEVALNLLVAPMNCGVGHEQMRTGTLHPVCCSSHAHPRW